MAWIFRRTHDHIYAQHIKCHANIKHWLYMGSQVPGGKKKVKRVLKMSSICT